MWKFVSLLKLLAGIALVVMAGITCLEIFTRAVFNKPILGSVEIVEFLCLIATAASLGYAQKRKAMIAVEIVYDRCPEPVKLVLDILTQVLSIFLCLVISYQTYLYAENIKLSKQVSLTLELPYFWLVYFMAFCFVVAAVVILLELVETFKK